MKQKRREQPATSDPHGRRPDAAFGEPRSAIEVCEAIEDMTGCGSFHPKAARRVEGDVPMERVHMLAGMLRNRLGFEHLSAISCVDWIETGEFQLVYHLWSYRDNCLIMVKTRIPRKRPHMPTLTDMWQPALFFERDIHEMFGVVFDGNNNLEKYILTDWPGPPPMRKDFVTRQYAHEQFTFKDYKPDWDAIIDGGYHGNILPPETVSAGAARTDGPSGDDDKERSDG
jgi:NADH-quinone oxidoreductase subunit C